MTALPDNSGKIKIVLTREDVKELGVSLQTIDCSDPDTRLLLRAVFQLAAYRLGKNFRSKRLLIEAYPYINGGGILYFTPLEERRPVKRLRLKGSAPSRNCFNYIFKEGDELLTAIDILYKNNDTRNLASCVYSLDDGFWLTVYSGKPYVPLQEIKEFTLNCLTGEGPKKYAREHGTALTGEKAIQEIGSKISRDSLKN